MPVLRLRRLLEGLSDTNSVLQSNVEFQMGKVEISLEKNHFRA